MSDKDKDSFLQDEYQLPEEEYTTPEATADHEEGVFAGEEEVVKSSIMSKYLSYLPQTRNKRILFVAAFVILIVFALHFLRSSTESSSPVTAAAAPVQTKPVVQPTMNDQPVMPTSAPVLTEAQSPKTADELSNLQSQIGQLQSTMASTQSTNTALKQEVSALAKQVSMLTGKLDSAVDSLSVQKKSGMRVVYYIRAVIPDRAWLVSNSGQSISVTIGDKIKQYGTVSAINPKEGVITTSSGRKIYYGMNDF